MQTMQQPTQLGEAVLVDVGTTLDCSKSGLMQATARMMKAKTIGAVMLDLRDTQQLRDSGLALLLNLHRRAQAAQQQIYLMHCPQELRQRLAAVGIDRLFRFV